MVFKVIVIELTGKPMVIDLCDTEEQFKTITVEHLREEFYKRTGIPKDDLRLIFGKWQLEDQNLLCDYGIQDMSKIQSVNRLPGGTKVPEKGDGGMGDKDKSDSMERLPDF